MAGLGGGMEYHGRLPARARRGEPSWPHVIATTVRLWFERHPLFGRHPLPASPGTRRRRIVTALVAVAVIAVGGGVAGVVIWQAAAPSTPTMSFAPSAATQPRGEQPGPGAAAALGASEATRASTAAWVAGQVAPGAIVACDPAMCATLQQRGIPAARLLSLGTAAPDPLGSDVVIATPAVRNQFGARLAGVYAPGLIATFGSGSGRIDVRAIAADGTAAYQSALSADRRSRLAAGGQLLHNPRISLTAAARQSLSTGDVDSRLLITLAALAGQQPVRVTAFGDPSPGAGKALPLRSASIAPLASGARARSGLRSMLSFVQAQQQPFLPLRAAVAGASVVTVEYAAPSPLGLISGP
jgi:hypothetical protein